MDVLQQRLANAGLGDETFEFVLQGDETSSTSRKGEQYDVVHVKTLIWEAEIQRSGQENGEIIPPTISQLYFATALCYHDRVDEDRLKRRLLELKLDNSDNDLPIGNSAASGGEKPAIVREVISLKLAETTKAEELAGYMSGTIPPFGHTTPLLLFVEQALVDEHEQHHNNDTDVDSTITDEPRKRRKIFSTGSGSFRHSLWILWEDMLQFARVLGNGVSITSISVSPPQQPSAKTNTSCATGNTDSGRGSSITVDKDDDDEGEEVHGPYTVIPMSDEMKSLGRLLRDSALREGKSKVIRTVITQAGDRFPEVGRQCPSSVKLKFNCDIRLCLLNHSLSLHAMLCQLFQMGTELNFSRNAMHLAAWKSDLESIHLLVDAGTQYGLDLANTISTGHGNFGKTRTLPVFSVNALSALPNGDRVEF